MLTILALISLAQAAPHPIFAAHRGVWTGSAMEWSSTIHLDSDGGGTTPLAAPLPADATLSAAHASPIRDDTGQITALEITPGARRVDLRIRRPLSDLDAPSLHPPLLSGSGVQRIIVDGVVFVPDPRLGIERHLRYFSQTDISQDERRTLNRKIDDRRTRSRDQAIYLRADDRLHEGLIGSLDARGRISTTVSAAIAASFAVVLSTLFFAQRWLSHLARREEVDGYIDREFVWPIAPNSETRPDVEHPTDGEDGVGAEPGSPGPAAAEDQPQVLNR